MTSQQQPWDSWPVELPMADQLPDNEPYALFRDDAFLATMAGEVRALVFDDVHAQATAAQKAAGGALLFGGTSAAFEFYDSDTCIQDFRQEAFFRYVFPINEPDCYGLLDVAKREAVLFVPPVSDDSQRWNGARRPTSYYKERYGVDACHLTTELEAVLQQRGLTHLLVLDGTNTDSDLRTKTTASFDGMVEKYAVDTQLLYPLMQERRVTKTEKEVRLMREGALVSSQAHIYVMRHAKPGMTELQLEALFKAWTLYHAGARHMAYTCICACGPNGATLHYGHAARPNDRLLRNGDFAVLDMGAEYSGAFKHLFSLIAIRSCCLLLQNTHSFCIAFLLSLSLPGYATDITRSFPINGTFTTQQRAVHNAVRAAQQAVFDGCKPGADYVALHRVAERVIVEHLITMGVLKGGSVDDMLAAHMGSVFMPHGLGHLIGLYVHDVGGFTHDHGREEEPGRFNRALNCYSIITCLPYKFASKNSLFNSFVIIHLTRSLLPPPHAAVARGYGAHRRAGPLFLPAVAAKSAAEPDAGGVH
jgi:Xaa-Pro dipeptidase